MTNMLSTIVPKSDQLNADDLIGARTLTIKVTSVSLAMGEQPVSIHYDGDNGKPYKPGKSMRRVLVNCWGSDANLYVGRSMTLYRDERVKFAGAEVGGIRISHLSDIPGEMTMALTTTKAQRRPFTVKPLEHARASTATVDIEPWLADIEKCADEPHLEQKYKAAYRVFKDDPASLARLTEAKDKRKQQLSSTAEA